MILATSILDGFKREISTKVYGFWGHIHITDTNINRSLEQIPISKTSPFLKDILDIESVQYEKPQRILGIYETGRMLTKSTHGGVKHMQPFALSPGIITTKKDFGGIILKGVDEKFNWSYKEDLIQKGEPLQLDVDASADIVISKVTARKMELDIDDKIIVSFIINGKQRKKRFQVSGIYNTGLEEYDDRFAYVDLRVVQDMLGWTSDQVSGIEIQLDDVEDAEIIDQYIYDIVPIEYYTETIRRKFPSIFEWLKLQDINMVLILVLMIIVSVINMITALLILILERTNMIGTLKALGTGNFEIRKIFIVQAAYIISIGLIIGNILGVGLALLQQHFHIIKLDEASYYLSYAPILLNPLKVIGLNILCFAIIVIFLFIPSYIITKISPIKALSFG